MELRFGTFLNNATLRILAQLRLLIVFEGVLRLCFTNGFLLYCIVLGLLCCCPRRANCQKWCAPRVLLVCFLPYPAPNLETDF
jgi:hypothetical protein